MKKRSGFIKNIIMVVASALTLIAVSFAWFTSSFSTNLEEYKATIAGESIKVDFYQADEQGSYQPLSGDIELEEFVPGSFNQYKFIVTTKTADKLKMKFSIDGLPENMPTELEDYVCIRYTMYTTSKRVSGETVTYTDQQLITQSDGFVPLSELNEGRIFTDLSLANYQTTSSDSFAIYYEIGLSENAPATVGGLESSLGSINISAQRIG